MRVLLLLPVVVVVAAAGCRNGEINLFGYTSAPPFDPNVRSVYIPVFKTTAFVANPNNGIEVRVTQALVEELTGRRTPMKVVSDPSQADTELVGTITNILKPSYNRSFQNHNREFETIIFADIVWRDLRSGRVLTGTRGPVLPERPVPFDPTLPPPSEPLGPPIATPVVVRGVGRTLFELGETSATGEDMAIRDLCRRIVNLMETPW